ARLVDAGLKEGLDSTEVVIAPQGGSGLLYVAPRAEDRIPAILTFLRAQPYIGEVFYGPEMLHIGQRPENGLHIAFAMARTAEPNEFGVPGLISVCVSDENPAKPEGFGSEGGLGDFDRHPFLSANGGGFAPGT